MSEQKNILAGEKSPYLLQHKENPVPWQPWGQDAFNRAQREDKPIFLSIGYSTCYWCHVMERDSFEQMDVAELLAKDFISIKVDREEFPDVDQIYMDVVVGIHGHGGWPMSVFLTPTGHPIWGGTFFYREQFKGLLQGIAKAWRADRQRVLASSNDLTQYLKRKAAKPQQALSLEGDALLHQAAEQLVGRYDTEWGGFGGAPKFPPSQQIRVLLRSYYESGSAAALEAATGTLSHMALGGIFDHVGGGFHRYSVDEQWLIPHFEKMLYDNALLVPVYLEAYQITRKDLYRRTAAATLEYLVTDMCSAEGGFFTAEDAGEVGKEGEFYVWTPEQVRAVCGAEAGSRVCDLFGIIPGGNFEHGTSVLSLRSEADFSESIQGQCKIARDALSQERCKRVRPHRDEKILTGWNGLAITALCKGYMVLGDPRYLAYASQAARWLMTEMASGPILQRRFFAGSSGIEAVLEDYAYLIQGLLALYEASAEREFLSCAARLQDEQDRRLWSEEHSAYLTSAQPGLIVSQCEWDDGATPSPNGVALMNLVWLSQLTGELRFEERLRQIVAGVPGAAKSFPSAYPSTVLATWSLSRECSTISVSSNAGKAKPSPAVFNLWSRFLPLSAVLWGEAGKAAGFASEAHAETVYIPCKGRVCFEPTVDVEAVLRLCSPKV